MAISQGIVQAVLGQRAPDITGAFQRGQDTSMQRQEQARQNKIRELTGQATQGEEGALSELEGIAPEAAFKLRESMGAKDDAAVDRFLRDARTGQSMLAAGEDQAFISFARQRIASLRAMGDDPTQTQFILDKVLAGDSAGALTTLTSITSGVDELKKQGDTPRQREFAQFTAMPENTEAEITAKRQFGQAIGAITKLKERVSADTLRAEEFAKSSGKAGGKSTEERQQDFISKGVEAADSTANLRRTLSLLDEIKTGGLASANLKAKRLLGIEGASEGELANALGVAVLAQLKPIFGAAFTVGEVKRLEDLSAGFGKSPAANRRILESALKIATKSARRGIRAAEARGDDETANQIREAMEFSLEPVQEAAAPPAQTASGAVNWSDL